MVADVKAARRPSPAGLRRFLDLRTQQRDSDAWGEAVPRDADARQEALELRLRYVARYEEAAAPAAGAGGPGGAPSLRPRLHPGPAPNRAALYWSVSCSPSTPGKALVRVNASWMELFSLYADGDGIRALFLVHLSDFTTDRSLDHDRVDEAFLERCVVMPEDVGPHLPRGEDIFGVKIRGFASIRQVPCGTACAAGRRAFSLTHMNRGRNAYQASHCYNLAADHMLGDAGR